jgi:hypothetical protein
LPVGLFTTIWYIVRPFGIFYIRLFGIFFQFWYVVPRKIWQPWSRVSSPKRFRRRAKSCPKYFTHYFPHTLQGFWERKKKVPKAHFHFWTDTDLHKKARKKALIEAYLKLVRQICQTRSDCSPRTLSDSTSLKVPGRTAPCWTAPSWTAPSRPAT